MYYYYILRLLKENVAYVATLIGAVAAIIFISFIFLQKLGDRNTKLAELSKDVVDLKEKMAYVNVKDTVTNEGYNLDTMNQILARLVPDSEDFFSIIEALERLSQDSHFVITSYQIRLGEVKDRLAIQISGSGDRESFLAFLKNYNFGGGRLTTIDKIDFRGIGADITSIDVTFYSGKAIVASTKPVFTKADKDFIKTISGKISFEIKSSPAESSVTYETKQNPF
ncbi:hypothetical protein HY214_03595 [Candidatus Roizmanbacteria bacterium]|nr:hypothetical protein [Candidatus Roizmanbacteria bacterium]